MANTTMMTRWFDTPRGATWAMRMWGLINVPLIFFMWPRIEDISDERIEVSIPLNRLTKNHFRSLYLAVLAGGADLAGGLLVFRCIQRSPLKVSLIFKDLQASFLRRAEAATHFICEDGKSIAALVQEALDTGERVNATVNIRGVCPRLSQETVAEFKLTLSLKRM